MSERNVSTDPLTVRSLLVSSDVPADEGFDDELLDDIVNAVVGWRDYEAAKQERQEGGDRGEDPEFDKGWDECGTEADRNRQADKVIGAVRKLQQAIRACDAEHMGVLSTVYRSLTVKDNCPVSDTPHAHWQTLETDLERLALAAKKTKTKRGRRPDSYTRLLTEVAQAIKQFGETRQEPLDMGEESGKPSAAYPPLQRDSHLALVIREVMAAVEAPVPARIKDNTLLRYAQCDDKSLIEKRR